MSRHAAPPRWMVNWAALEGRVVVQSHHHRGYWALPLAPPEGAIPLQTDNSPRIWKLTTRKELLWWLSLNTLGAWSKIYPTRMHFVNSKGKST